jgi:hypothetical protein
MRAAARTVTPPEATSWKRVARPDSLEPDGIENLTPPRFRVVVAAGAIGPDESRRSPIPTP